MRHGGDRQECGVEDAGGSAVQRMQEGVWLEGWGMGVQEAVWTCQGGGACRHMQAMGPEVWQVSWHSRGGARGSMSTGAGGLMVRYVWSNAEAVVS